MKNFNEFNRVVITGIGIISPLGIGTNQNWSALLNGKSGLVDVGFQKFSRIPCHVGGKIPFEIGSNESLKNLITKTKSLQYKSLTLSSIYAMIAANEAIDDSKLFLTNNGDEQHAGVSIGCGMVSMEDVGGAYEALHANPSARLSPYFMPKVLSNMAAGHIAISHDFRGPNHSVSTACATGLHAIGDAYLVIKQGLADVMVCGGSEAPIYPLAYAGFSAMRALSTNHNAVPASSSRPFDESRDGFVPSEGSAILVLERLSHALERSAPTYYAEVVGFGSACDAHHVTAPSPEPRAGAYTSMKKALTQAALAPRGDGELEIVARTLSLVHVNAHATSTPAGDNAELRAIETLIGDIKSQSDDASKHTKVAVTSNKGALGHMLGAAGSAEAAFTALTLHHRIVPHNLNLTKADYEPLSSTQFESPFENENINLVRDEPIKLAQACSGKRLVVLKNSFGFGVLTHPCVWHPSTNYPLTTNFCSLHT